MRKLNLLSLVSKKSFTVLAANLIVAACGQLVISQTIKTDKNNFINTAAMNIETFDKPSENKFYDVLSEILAKRGVKADALCNREDALERRILEDYGAVFLARHDKVLPPPVCIFTDAKQVLQFQTKATSATAEIAGAKIELQPAAMCALIAAREAALAENLDITPRDGAEAGRRLYEDTIRLWNSRFYPALDYWQNRGRITADQIWDLKALPIREQVIAVLELEKDGIFFNTFFNNSILYSVAAPGASQHLSMLAFDANEFGDKQVRKILADHGWFRTVKGDAPHFTFLGVKEDDLPSLGLKKVKTGDGEFWIPNV
ncbi:MAG TPA: hypothetical protein VGB02_18260 [Pyrinomonadaceae bacterium]|jgi:hypothetical protein